MNDETARDYLEIQCLLTQYVFAIDQKDYDLLDTLFCPKATLTYHLDGGRIASGSYADMKQWIAGTLDQFSMSQHFLGLPQIIVEEASARAKSMLFNPMLLRRGEREDLFFVGGVYEDVLEKRDGRWLILERVEKGLWQVGTPADWTPAEVNAGAAPL